MQTWSKINTLITQPYASGLHSCLLYQTNKDTPKNANTGQIDKARSAGYETDITAGHSAECQSYCWSWPPHMALCPGYASRCVTSESAVCVCVCAFVCLSETHTHLHTLWIEQLVITLFSLYSSYGYSSFITRSHHPIFIGTSIFVMDVVRLLSPWQGTTECDITHMFPPWGWRG